MTTMKAEINARGSWRSLIEFECARETDVRIILDQLLRTDAQPPKARIVGGANVVIAYWTSKDGWVAPDWRRPM